MKKMPGFILSLVIAVIAQLLAKFYLPMLGGATLALFIGIILGNTYFKQGVLAAGTKFAEKNLLEYSVMLLGATITFQSIRQIGLKGILFTIIQMSVTIGFALWFGRYLQFNRQTTMLMAGGNAVCGSSAIGAIGPVIDADEKATGTSITLVNLTGTVLMLVLPLISGLLWPQNADYAGMLIGGTIQSVGQVVASASMMNDQTVITATLFKIMRIICLVFIVSGFGYWHQKSQKNNQSTRENTGQKQYQMRQLVPWYVIGFFSFCLLSSLHWLPAPLISLSHQLSTWCEITALAAIGLRLNLKQLFSKGKQLLMYAGAIGIVQVVLAVILITVLYA